MNNSEDSAIIYPNLKAAAAAVCQEWCQTHGYRDCFLNGANAPTSFRDVALLRSAVSLQRVTDPQRAASLLPRR